VADVEEGRIRMLGMEEHIHVPRMTTYTMGEAKHCVTTVYFRHFVNVYCAVREQCSH
jgi:hypothetical protein